MTHFYIKTPARADEIVLTGPEQHHLTRVHRAQVGDHIWLFDEAGGEYQAEIVGCDSREVKLRVLQRRSANRPAPLRISLAQGLLKSKTWDLLLQKSMELGLDCLRPVLTEYVACGANTAGRCERWQQVLIAAAKQCGRSVVFPIAPLQKFPETLSATSHIPLRLLAHNEATLPSLKSVLDRVEKPVSEILVIVGPEGGFSAKELALAGQMGVQMFSLGAYTLRAETAAMAIVANLRFFFFDL